MWASLSCQPLLKWFIYLYNIKPSLNSQWALYNGKGGGREGRGAAQRDNCYEICQTYHCYAVILMHSFACWFWNGLTLQTEPWPVGLTVKLWSLWTCFLIKCDLPARLRQDSEIADLLLIDRCLLLLFILPLVMANSHKTFRQSF